MSTTTEQRLDRFARRLAEEGLAPGTVHQYKLVLQAALGSRNPMIPRIAHMRQKGLSRRKVILAALGHWARIEKNHMLESWVQAVETAAVRHETVAPALRTSMTREARAKLVAAVEARNEPAKLGLLLLVWSGLRLGAVLALTREELAAMPLGRPEAQAAARRLAKLPSWTRVGDLWSTSGYVAQYAAVRRQLKEACRTAGIHYRAPEEFRRLLLQERLPSAGVQQRRGRGKKGRVRA